MCDEIIEILSNSNTSSHSRVSCHICKNCLEKHPIVVGKTVFYIVGAVVFNENGEVLLIQEAKASCRGTWYLPAGRVESNETLIEAVKREVLEEAGLIFEPSGIVCVEENSGRWVRFIFAGSLVGGNIKTSEEADSESLQAAWISDLLSVKLRSSDILNAVGSAKIYYKEKSSNPAQRGLNILPCITSFKNVSIRALILYQTQNISPNVLLISSGSEDGNYQFALPVSCFEPFHNLYETVKRILNACLPSSFLEYCNAEVVGVLKVEHSGKSRQFFDGLCLTVLSVLTHDNEILGHLPQLDNSHAKWCQLDTDLLNSYPELVDRKRQNQLCAILSSL